MQTITIGKKYLNGRKEVITIVGTVDPSSGDYSLGHRFVDQNGTGYTENGLFNKNNPAHAFNLVGEMPDSAGNNGTVVGGVSAEQTGFFENLGNKMSENPFKTMLGLTVVAGAGYAAYNYSTTGSITGDPTEAADLAEAGAAFLGAWR